MPSKRIRSSAQPAPGFHMSTRRSTRQRLNATISELDRTDQPAEVPSSETTKLASGTKRSSSETLNSSAGNGHLPEINRAATTASPRPKKRKASDIEAPESDSADARLLLSLLTHVSSAVTSSSESTTDFTGPETQATSQNTSPQPSTETTLYGNDVQPDDIDHPLLLPGRKAPDVDTDEKYNQRLTHDEWKSKRYWPRYDDKRKVYYGADGATRYKPNSQKPSQRNSPNTGSPRRPARGGRGARGRGGGNGNGNGRGRGRPKGRGGREDSPEPPRKRLLTGDEEEIIKRLKARQQELKKVFNTIGAQQIELLDTIATRDINKLCRKPKAHKNISEYEAVVADLDDTTDDIQQMIRDRFEFFIENEKQRFEHEKELIEQQFRQKCDQVKEEHLEGCNGDITLLKKAHAHDEDEDRTESGSERDFIPFHHELPESNTHARGYTSRAVRDDKSMREYHESQDDHVRQEVMQEELQPLLEFIAKAKMERQAEIDREKTQNLESLAKEAEHRLKMEAIGGYLIPRPLAGHENHAYGLSALADVADFVAQHHPRQSYVFMPLSPGHDFPRNALNYDPLPGQRSIASIVAPVVSPPAPVQAVQQQQPATPPRPRRTSAQLQTPVKLQPAAPSPQVQAVPVYYPRSQAPIPTQPEQSPIRPVPAPREPFQAPKPHLQPQHQNQSQSQSHSSQTRHLQSPMQTLAQLPPPPPPSAPQHQIQQQPQTASYHRPPVNVQTSSNGIGSSRSRQSSLSTPTTPQVVSTGPGLPIAPAPPKMTPLSMPPSFQHRMSDPPLFRQSSYQTVQPAPLALQPFPPYPSPRSFAPPALYPQPPRPPPQQQQYIFQPPQQPPQHVPAPPPASLGSAWVPRYSAPANPNSNNPNISSITTIGAGMGHTGKIPVTFVNQTVASRKAAAAAKMRRERIDGDEGKEGKGSASGSGGGGGSEAGESEGGSRPSSVEAGEGRGSNNGNGTVGGGVRMLLPKV